MVQSLAGRLTWLGPLALSLAALGFAVELAVIYLLWRLRDRQHEKAWRVVAAIVVVASLLLPVSSFVARLATPQGRPAKGDLGLLPMVGLVLADIALLAVVGGALVLSCWAVVYPFYQHVKQGTHGAWYVAAVALFVCGFSLAFHSCSHERVVPDRSVVYGFPLPVAVVLRESQGDHQWVWHDKPLMAIANLLLAVGCPMVPLSALLAVKAGRARRRGEYSATVGEDPRGT